MKLHVNGRQFIHTVSREPFEGDLLSWLGAQEEFPKCYFKSSDLEAACVGSILHTGSVPIFGEENNSKARFWGGQVFDNSSNDTLWSGFPKCFYFLPRYEVIRKEGKTHLLTHSLNRESTIRFSTPRLHEPLFREYADFFRDCLTQIERGSFEKIVLAWRLSLESELIPSFAPLSTFETPNGALFGFQFSKGKAFLGASPEKLYRRKGKRLYTEAIAGTRPLGKEEELLSDEKERREFDHVKQSILEKLKDLSISIAMSDRDKTVQAANVQHLHRSFEAELKEARDDEIIKALHPTAAIGGYPNDAALEYIEKHEPFDRGWYASPVGYVSQDEAELIVAIRSALFCEKHLHLFAGSGIVKGSTLEREWSELQQKFKLWKTGAICSSTALSS